MVTASNPIQSWLRRINRTGPPEAAMTHLAEGLLNQYRTAHPRGRFPPHAENLAPLRDIFIDRDRESASSGHLQVSRNGFVLRLGAAGNVSRRNFTIAHEIGHTF